jgi:hypothetical protein
MQYWLTLITALQRTRRRIRPRALASSQPRVCTPEKSIASLTFAAKGEMIQIQMGKLCAEGLKCCRASFSPAAWVN